MSFWGTFRALSGCSSERRRTQHGQFPLPSRRAPRNGSLNPLALRNFSANPLRIAHTFPAQRLKRLLDHCATLFRLPELCASARIAIGIAVMAISERRPRLLYPVHRREHGVRFCSLGRCAITLAALRLRLVFLLQDLGRARSMLFRIQ